MPVQLGSESQSRNLLSERFGEFLAIFPEESCPNLAARDAATETLRRQTDLAAVIVLQQVSLLAQVFQEAWKTLPGRLASLACSPPTATLVVIRTTDADRLLRNSRNTDAALWRCLVEIARAGLRVAVLTAQASQAVATIPADPGTQNWLPGLLSSPPRRELAWLLNELRLARSSDLFGSIKSPADATAVFAGLWLLHGDASASHRQSQSIEDEGRHRNGNFWHAIMHRQEPDYGNAKYWFRRVGQHPIFPELACRADQLIQADGSETALCWRNKLGAPHRWDPFVFVDWCESAASAAESSSVPLLRAIQFIEMFLLLRASSRDAIGDL